MSVSVTTRRIRIAAHDGGEFEGYLAVPASGSGPGLVLCQEIFGLNGFVRQTAERLAEEGYVVLAPDLFWRQQPGIERPTVRTTCRAPSRCTRASTRIWACATSVRRWRRCARCPSSRAAWARWATAWAASWPIWRPAAATWTWPWATTASASRTAWRKRPGARGRWCCTSPSATASVLPRRASASTAALGGKPGVELYGIRAWTTPSPAPAARTTTSPPR